MFGEPDVPGAVPRIDIARRCHRRRKMGGRWSDLEEHDLPPVNLLSAYLRRPLAQRRSEPLEPFDGALRFGVGQTQDATVIIHPDDQNAAFAVREGYEVSRDDTVRRKRCFELHRRGFAVLDKLGQPR